jgi:hypothetical protein
MPPSPPPSTATPTPVRVKSPPTTPHLTPLPGLYRTPPLLCVRRGGCIKDTAHTCGIEGERSRQCTTQTRKGEWAVWHITLAVEGEGAARRTTWWGEGEGAAQHSTQPGQEGKSEQGEAVQPGQAGMGEQDGAQPR